MVRQSARYTAGWLGVACLLLSGCAGAPPAPVVPGEAGWEFLTYDPPTQFVARDPAIRAALEARDKAYITGLMMNAQQLRAFTDEFNRQFPRLDEPVARVEDRTIPGPGGEIPIRVLVPRDAGPRPVIVYYHGGGWTRGSLVTHGDLARSICRRTGALVIFPLYRLSPEHKFPAGFDDCYATLLWAAQHAGELGGDGARLAVAGDSAGANLAAAVALAARDRRGPRLAFQALGYPVLSFRYDTASYAQFSGGYGLSAEVMQRLAGWYLAQPEDAQNPYAAPLRAKDVSGVPPAFIAVGNYDVLRDDGIAYGARLHRAGVATRVVCYQKFAHAFLQDNTKYPAADRALDDFCAALREGLGERR